MFTSPVQPPPSPHKVVSSPVSADPHPTCRPHPGTRMVGESVGTEGEIVGGGGVRHVVADGAGEGVGVVDVTVAAETAAAAGSVVGSGFRSSSPAQISPRRYKDEPPEPEVEETVEDKEAENNKDLVDVSPGDDELKEAQTRRVNMKRHHYDDLVNSALKMQNDLRLELEDSKVTMQLLESTNRSGFILEANKILRLQVAELNRTLDLAEESKAMRSHESYGRGMNENSRRKELPSLLTSLMIVVFSLFAGWIMGQRVW